MNSILLFAHDLAESGTHAILTGRRLGHLLSVCRVKPGDTLKAGLLNGKMGDALVRNVDNARIELELVLDRDPPAPLPITLLLAMCRPKSLKKALESAVCMGVKRIYIMESWRVEKSYWTSPVLRDAALHELMILALEQSRDTVLPEIRQARRFKPFLEDEVPAIVAGTRPMVAHPYGAGPCPHAPHGNLTLAIGPEGGFIPYEIDMFKSKGFEAVTTGERILRVEHAVPAFLGRLFR